MVKKKIDVAEKSGQGWIYSPKVKEHFFHPKNFSLDGKLDFKPNGMGMVGSPACGDVMKMWLYVDPKMEKIKKCAWQTFGCASAIASTSVLSVMLVEKGGMKIDKALRIKPQDILKRLGGLPARKVHCSVLGDKTLRAAVNDYFRKTRQLDRIIPEGARVIDKVLKITDKDIEAAVLEGARTLVQVQQKTKVGLGDPSCLPEAKELTRFYVEKYCEI
ncbi:MAG: iron-sulfur cluster assembly scaffold protein [bacterium]|nr:iron-sulfur cluster assembly scaffold protein [bacterium]